MSQRPKPKDVWSNPHKYWSYLTAKTDSEFEGQHFDRKEAARPRPEGNIAPSDLKNLKLHAQKCLSAFANSNVDGGLLVFGISKVGRVEGLSHLSETDVISLFQLDGILRFHGGQTKLFDCSIDDGASSHIALFYVPFCSRSICETLETPPRAWRRDGYNNHLLTDDERDQIRRDRKLVDFELTHCAPFQIDQIDTGVLNEFMKSVLSEANLEWTDENLLTHVSAIQLESNSKWFTNSGMLFFGGNPQSALPAAYIRVLRFDTTIDQRDVRTTPNFDRNFVGPITKQISDFRTFVRDSGFFKTYQLRAEDGGFVDEPELPMVAIDEALVNAVAHRDYGISRPILFEKYNDALLIRSPGRLKQSRTLPDHFTLDDTRLEHNTRNPKLVEWLRQIRDPRGAPFLLALQEGTQRMRDEMAKLGLSAPVYQIDQSHTDVILLSNAKTREIAVRQQVTIDSTESVNLFALTGYVQGKQGRMKAVAVLAERLESFDWFVDRLSHGVLTCHLRAKAHPASAKVSRYVRIYSGYQFQVRSYFGRWYLLIDASVIVQSVSTLKLLLRHFSADSMIGKRGYANVGEWRPIRIRSISDNMCELIDIDSEETLTAPSTDIIPQLSRVEIDKVLTLENVSYDLSREIGKASLRFEKQSARIRANQTRTLVERLSMEVFPIDLDGAKVSLSKTPLPVRPGGDGRTALRSDGLPEPKVEFARQHTVDNIRDGITTFGSYDHHPRDIEIVPICEPAHVGPMKNLIRRMREGKFKFRGAERTFSVRLTEHEALVSSSSNLSQRCEQAIDENPNWAGREGWPRIFLVHTPEKGFALDDETSPYYTVKRVLLEAGIPCQMVNTPTLANPDFRDLNLALNIVAKCGVAPWVLPESIPDADFFVGLSYTQSRRDRGRKIMGFANVFNEYGRWEFYSSGSAPFDYEQRHDAYETLIRDTLSRLNLSNEPRLCFQYSARFSLEDRLAILRGARSVRPNGTYTFMWINSHHNVRMYDSRSEGNGSAIRGHYIIAGPRQLYLSTTGHNPYRRTMGTPQPIEINVWTYRPNSDDCERNIDHRSTAAQVLALTKLNWASTDSLCGEPITTKYAGDIAYLTAAFRRQSGNFKLHPILERTPWFI